MRVRESRDFGEQGSRLVDAFSAAEGLAVGSWANGGPKKGEGSRRDEADPSWEGTHVDTVVRATGVELQANLTRSCSQAGQASSNVAIIAGKAHVIEEGKDQEGGDGPAPAACRAGWRAKEKSNGPSGSPCWTPASEDKHASPKRRRL